MLTLQEKIEIIWSENTSHRIEVNVVNDKFESTGSVKI